MGDPDVWPVLLDMSRDDCKRILRRLELEAYSNLVSVLRAQGSLTTQKRRLLQSVAQTLGISEERHKAECRRAVNSEKLATIAKHMGGANSGTEWAIEGRRLVPLLPRLVPQTAFTAIADKVANMAMTEGAKLPLPTPPVKKRLSSPPIDETLLEPNVPEASKTPHVSSGTPLLLSLPGGEMSQHPQSEKLFPSSPAELTPPSQVSPSPLIQSQGQISGTYSIPVTNSLNLIPQKVKQEEERVAQNSQEPAFPVISSNNIQPSCQTSHHHTAQKSQFVLLVKKEDRLKDERLSRKRPRSASLDVPLNIPVLGSMMPPPVKKEAISPLSPVGTISPLAQLPSTISPQSHSQLVQQQTLQAAAAAAAAVAASPPPPTHPPQQQQQAVPVPQCQPSPPPPPPPPPAPATLPAQPSQAAPVVPQPQQHTSNLPASTPSTNPTGRTITIPSQGAVKLSLTSTSSSGSGIPSGTHKVIIVSSTTPSILQRSLSVPVVKSLSTNAPSQPCSSTLVLNTAQQNQQAASNSTATASSDIITTTSSQQVVSTTLSSKVQGKLLPQSTPKARPRANSIVIPVTPNQSNVMNSVGVTSVQLKSALQGGKPGVLKAGDATGLKIMPLTNVSGSSKLMQKTPGSGPMYVVSTSTASPTVSMVARTVSSGQRVMTFTSSGPKVAVSASQASNILSKPVQTLQLAQASGVMTSSGTIPLSSTSGKPNVIVVQKGSTAFGRGVTISHGGKEVVGKVLLGGKALTSLNQSQSPASPNSSANSPALTQAIPNQTSQTFAQQQSTQVSLPTTSTSTRVVTVQKLPSAVVQGSTGSGNVIVLDLSQEQLNNSAVLNEILASSILQSSNVINYNHEAGNASMNSLRGLINFPSEQSEAEPGVLSNEDNNILVEGFGQIMGRSDNNIATVGSNITSDFSVEMSPNPETSESFIMDSSSFYHGGQTPNNTTAQSSRVHTDICATAMSNANLNLNDFLDDSSLDDIQPISLEAMKMELATEMSSDPENNSNCGNTDENVGTAVDRVGNWVPSGNSLRADN